MSGGIASLQLIYTDPVFCLPLKDRIPAKLVLVPTGAGSGNPVIPPENFKSDRYKRTIYENIQTDFGYLCNITKVIGDLSILYHLSLMFS